MALLYGDGDLKRTIDVAGLAGWDADNNMTTSAGLIGILIGFDDLPDHSRRPPIFISTKTSAAICLSSTQ